MDKKGSTQSSQEKKTLAKRATPLEQYLSSYQKCGAVVSSDTQVRKQNKLAPQKADGAGKRLTDEPPKEKETKKGTKAWLRGLFAGVAVVAVFLTSFTLIYVHREKQAKEQARNSEMLADIAQYTSTIESAAEVTTAFGEMRFDSVAEALTTLTEMVNPGLTETWKLSYEFGASYATGKADPWGNVYYFTAKRIASEKTGTEDLYDFYITCAGQNGEFDTDSFTLDQDDYATMLISMYDYADMRGEHVVLDPEETDEPSTGIDVPLTFDMAGGSGGTSFIEVTMGDTLPIIDVPEKEGYDFQGYYEFPDGVGMRYYNADGTGAIRSPFDTGTTLYAAWTEAKEIVEEETEENQENADTSDEQPNDETESESEDGEDQEEE